jgi:O-antigen/teichoic acid export membrane protein
VNLNKSFFQRLLSHELLQKGGVYLVGNLLNKSIPFLMIPIMTRYLSPEGYGQVSTFQALYGIALALISVSINSSIGLYYFNLRALEFRKYIFNSLVTSFVFFLLYTFFVFIFSSWLTSVMPFSLKWLYILGLYVFVNNVVELLLALFRAQKKPYSFIKLEIFRTILNFSLSLGAIILLQMDWEGRITGIVTSSLVAGILCVFILLKEQWIKPKISKTLIMMVLAYGAPLIPNVLARWSMTSIDRFFINHYVGVSETGLYSLGDQIGLIVGILVLSFHNAWLPFFFESLKKNEPLLKRKIVKFSYAYIVAIILIAFGLTAISPLLIRFMATPEYYKAQEYVLWISLGYAFSGMYYIFSGYLFYLKKTWLVAFCTTTGALVNILLNWFLIPDFGAMGAAYATLTAYMAIFLLAWLFSSRNYDMPWNLFKR